MTIDRAIEEFLLYMTVERNASPRTLPEYRRALLRFSSFAEKEKVNDPVDVTIFLVRRFIASLSADGGKVALVCQTLSALKTFFKFLQRRGVICHSPAEAVPFPKKPLILPKVLTESEAEAVVDGPFSSPSGPETGLEKMVRERNNSILEFLYSTGARISECSGVNISHVDKENRLVLLRGKGRKERIVPFGTPAWEKMETYLETRGCLFGKPRQDNPLYISYRNERLSRASIEEIMREAVSASGIRHTATPHTLRHSFATHMLGRGADIRTIQALLGHQTVTTTTIYAHIDYLSLIRQYRSYDPRMPESSGERKKNGG